MPRPDSVQRTLPGSKDGTGPRPGVAAPLPVVGERIGRYVVLERLGAGGMGVVFSTYDPELDRKVAVKLLQSDYGGTGRGSGSDGHRNRLLDEARALAKLSHPNVIAVHDVGVHEGRVFVAMEFVDGQTLATWQAQPSLPSSAILEVYRKAALGLAAAHRAGIVHADFKPDNVMIDADGRVRVLDFGLARPSATHGRPAPSGPTDVSPDLDGRGSGSIDLVGTPAYMAPEQFSGHPADARSDQFSFAVSLYEGLFGERPFVGNTLAELMVSTIEGKRKAPRAIDVPPHVLDVFKRALAKDPSERFADMASLLRALDGPHPRARRGWTRPAVGSVVGAGVVAALWLATGADGNCDRARFMPEAWSATHRDALEQRILDAEPTTSTTTRLTLEALDRYASAIAVQRETVCLASGPDASAEVVSTRCLDRAEQALAALTAMFEGEPSLVVEHGPEMVAGLAEAEACTTDRAWDVGQDVVEEQIVAIADAERELDMVSALLTAADTEAAAARLAPILELQGPAFRGTHARARYEQARLFGHDGQNDEKRRAAEDAFNAAVVAERHAIAIAAALLLAAHHGLELSDLPQGDFWLRSAEALLERHGASLDLVVAVQRARGRQAYASGNYDEAERHFQQALSSCRDGHADAPYLCVALHADLADSYRFNAKFEEALASYRTARDLNAERFGPEHPDTARVTMDIGVTLRGLEQIDEAISEQREGLRVAEKHWGPDSPEIVSFLGNLADTLMEADELAEARALLQRARGIIEEHFGEDHPMMSYLLGSEADLLLGLGQCEASATAADRAVRIRQAKMGDEHPQLVVLLQVLGDAAAASGDHGAAYEAFSRIRGIVESLGGAEGGLGHPELYLATAGMIDAAIELGRDEEARSLAADLPPLDDVRLPYLRGRIELAHAQLSPDQTVRNERLDRAAVDFAAAPELRARALGARVLAMRPQ